MSNGVYKILYCSRNLIEGARGEQDGQINQILATSRVNNMRQNVTGALLFNSGYFAQALEGPQKSVEQIFERIQRDSRHSDVTVLSSSSEEQRDFPDWSMAHVQPPSEAQAAGVVAALDMAMLKPEVAGSEILSLLTSLVVQEE